MGRSKQLQEPCLTAASGFRDPTREVWGPQRLTTYLPFRVCAGV